MRLLSRTGIFVVVFFMGLLACGTTVHAIYIDKTISLEYNVGDEIYAEIYRDAGASDGSELLARRAHRRYGLWPNWIEAYDNSHSENASYDRYAYLLATAQEAGQWSFVGEMGNRDDRNQGNGTSVAFVRINLTVYGNTGGLYPDGSSTGYVLCESLSIRESPDSYSNVVGTLSYGTTFPVLQKNGKWWYVHSNGQSGWINSNYALIDPQYFYPATETPVLAYASSDAKRVGLVEGGAQLAIIAETNDYYIVSLRGASGFVSKYK